MSEKLPCGCWSSCICELKAAAEKAKAILKLSGIEAISYVDRNSITLYLQPYQAYIKRRSYLRALRYVRYRSPQGLEKGIQRILSMKIENEEYLKLPPLPGYEKMSPKGKVLWTEPYVENS